MNRRRLVTNCHFSKTLLCCSVSIRHLPGGRDADRAPNLKNIFMLFDLNNDLTVFCDLITHINVPSKYSFQKQNTTY